MAKMAAPGVGVKVLKILLAVTLFSLATGGKRAVAQTHHVVGDDQGWSPSTDVVSWSTRRVFRVGDRIWFAYPATNESIVELQTAEEFSSCDLTNPIRMYTTGLDEVPLESEGIRYFTSASPDSCKNGLKLPVNVHPPLILPPFTHTPPFIPFTDPPPFIPSIIPPPPPFIPPIIRSPPPFIPSIIPPPPFIPPIIRSPPPFKPSIIPPPPFSHPPPPPHTPPPPSASAHLNVLSFTLFVGIVLCYMEAM